MERRDRIWQKPYIEKRRNEIRRLLPTASPGWVQKKVGRPFSSQSYSELLDVYLLSIEAAEPIFWGRGADEGVDSGFRVLEHLKIDPLRSKLSYLYRDLLRAKGLIVGRKGDRWAAYWLKRLAGAEGAGLRSALREFLPKISAGEGDELTFEIGASLPEQLSQLEKLRWAGRAEEARFLLDSILLPPETPDAWRKRIETLRASLAVQLLSTRAALKHAERIAKQHRHDKPWVEVYLWALAGPSKSAVRALDELPDLKDPRVPLVRLLLNRTTNEMTPKRIEAILLAAGPVVETVSPERLLLVWAAVGRWLLRHRRAGLADDFFFLYEALSRGLSQGRSNDALGVFGAEKICRAGAALEKIPASQFERWSQVGKMASAICQVGSKYLVRSPFQSRGGQRTELRRLEKAFSEIIFRYSDQLKGGWMKVGQFASYMGPDVGPDARRILSQLQQDSTPVASAHIRATVEKELGRPIERLFEYFSFVPFATGSIGQVHRARRSGGENVVVKIQYPEIRAILTRDLQSLALCVPLLRPFFRHWDFNALLLEFRKHFLSECDYEQEAKNQSELRRAFSDDSEIVIPRVYEELSSAHVLTSQFIPGRRFKEFRDTASQKERNRAAEIMTRWHWRSIFKIKMFSGDPHPGNFIFLPNQVAFIDYGNVKRWGGNGCEGIRGVMEGLMHDDFNEFARGYALAGMSSMESLIVYEEFQKIRRNVLGYLREDRVIRFDHEQALEYFRTCTTANPNTRHTVKITDECALLFKSHWSFFSTVGQLNPSLNWRRIYRGLYSGAP